MGTNGPANRSAGRDSANRQRRRGKNSGHAPKRGNGAAASNGGTGPYTCPAPSDATDDPKVIASGLEDGERRLKDFAEVSSDWLWEMDADLRFSWFSEAFERILGLSPEKRLGRSRFDLQLSDDDPEKWAQHNADLRARRPFRNFVYPYIDDSGHRRTIRLNGKPIFDHDGRFNGYRGSGTDITTEVAAEERARKAQLRLHDAIENIPVGLLLCDADDRVVAFNNRYVELFFAHRSDAVVPGMRFDEVVRNFADSGLGDAGDRAKKAWIRQRIARHQASGEPYEQNLPDGRVIRTNDRPTSDGGTISVYSDITDQQRQQQLLIDQSVLLQSTLDEMAQGLIAFSETLEILASNRRAAEVLDVPERLIAPGSNFADAIRYAAVRGDYGPGKPDKLYKKYMRLATGRKRPHGFERTLPNGKQIEVQGRPLPRGGFVVTYTDITVRKLAEEDLRQSEQRFRTLVESMNEGLMYRNTKGKLVYVNPTLCKMLGYREDALIGKPIKDLVADPYKQIFKDKLVGAKSGAAARYELGLKRKDGTTIFALIAPRPITDSKGRFAGAFTVVTDITKLKHVDDMLRDRNTVLEQLATGSPLDDVLEMLVATAERLRAGARCSVLLPDREKAAFEKVIAPSLPKYFRDGMKGLEIGPRASSCAAAAFSKTPVIVKDVQTDRNSKPLRALAQRAGLRGCSSVPILSSSGDLLGVVTIYDRTPRKPDRPELSIIETLAHLAGVAIEARLTENALRDSEARFRDVADVASDWFWEMDENLRFSYLSGRFEDITEIRSDLVIGKTRQEVAGSRVSDENWRRHLADLKARRAFRDFAYTHEHVDGRVTHMSTSGTPIIDENGEFKGYRGVGRDITTDVEAARSLNNAKEAAERANRAKSEFLANMSHELRTPLNAIIGFSQFMAKETLGPLGNANYKDYASDILESGDHLLSLINDLLDLSQVETGKFELREEVVDLRGIVEVCLRIIGDSAASGNVGITTRIERDLPKLCADPRACRQILLNILSNAVKFTPEGGKITISVRSDRGGSLLIAVSDTGVGMNRNDLSDAVVPFARSGNPYVAKRQGAGLGLPIVKSLVELHGGTLRLETRQGGGTSVRIRFPRDRVVGENS